MSLVGIEWAAARKHAKDPRTLTERLAKWFPKKWRRVVLVGLMALLTWHFWNAPDVVPVYGGW